MERHDQPMPEPNSTTARERGLDILLGTRANDAVLAFRLRSHLHDGDRQRKHVCAA